jgi:hypothetical protein
MPLEKSAADKAQATQLSRRQKRDLLELAAAGIVSAAFLATPLVFRPASTHGVITAQVSQAAPALTAGHTSANAGINPAAANVTNVRVVTTDVPATVSVPPLLPSRAVVAAVRRVAPPRRPHGSLASARTKLPLGRRIARLFAGDGTHTVQPFPTVPPTER